MKAYLVLENGKVFTGESFGASHDVTGEIVFTTAMTGYNETLTDPSYFGQIVVHTFPLIGNIGVISPDFESEQPQLKGYIVRDWCQEPSNFRSEGDLDTFLKKFDISGLYGIDTRALTKIVRSHGVMNGKIMYTEPTQEDINKLKSYKIENAVKSVGVKEEKLHKAENALYNIVLWDFGAKDNILRELLKRQCNVTVVPSFTTAERIKELNPDGLMLSNGPGDPAENKDIINEIAELMKSKIPTFGICLGHQLLALSQGAETKKLKYGHRGANQPAIETDTGRVYITSQNHGYYVVSESLKDGAYVSFKNGNDGTCEGINYKNIPAFSVQFHPEACGGPMDTNFLFDSFFNLIKEGKNNASK